MTQCSKQMIHAVAVGMIVAMCAAVTLSANAAQATAVANYQNINQVMTKIGKVMVEIYPLVVAKRKLKQREIKKIDVALNQLSELFAAAGPFIQQKSDG